jgi:regulator of sirC expression with transglutaminase-like and TPR domain
MIQWILIVDPHAVSELRERALIYDAMGNSDSAVKDLERYLEISPEAEDREDILLMIERLKHNPTRVH